MSLAFFDMILRSHLFPAFTDEQILSVKDRIISEMLFRGLIFGQFWIAAFL